ncbi:helix-turn-helix domain-containing protein [Nocardioides zeae]|uniref:PucR C-terminal helix-turn-helix domain-containing protein n=1 Tax=Nocardioides zeae TaxID=1457234 RepID=A0AAJ1U4Z8_9ACTN|nr:helix-turn-helix domain-containing protein [Nocardioides zeae]MDQ1105633.1 hypothetical protein [Nocardioides zeae]
MRRHLVVLERADTPAVHPAILGAVPIDAHSRLHLGPGPGLVAYAVGFDVRGAIAERVLRQAMGTSPASRGPLLGVGPALIGPAGAQVSLAIAAWLADHADHRADALRTAALVSALAQDAARARELVRDALGPLADDTETAAHDRRALSGYLEAGRSLQRAAQREHVHRNTMVYRIRRAAARLPAPLDGTETDVLCALRLIDVLGPGTLERLAAT